MGIDTKGIIGIRNTVADPFEINDIIHKVIHGLIDACPDVVAKRKIGYPVPWCIINREAEDAGKPVVYRMPITQMYGGGIQSISVNFTYCSEVRNLSVHFGCHSDYRELFVGRRIILSLGCWGHAEEIITAVLRRIGDGYGFATWIITNDCSSVPVVVTSAKDGTEAATLVPIVEKKRTRAKAELVHPPCYQTSKPKTKVNCP
jgi:hypothetical protein